METEGKVIRRGENNAIIQIRRKGACGDNCAHCSGCAAQLMEIESDCSIAVQNGDWVRIKSNHNMILVGLFVLFLMPVFLPIIAFLSTIGSGLEIFFVLLAIVISVILIILLNKSRWFRNASRPQVVEVIVKARNEDE